MRLRLFLATVLGPLATVGLLAAFACNGTPPPAQCPALAPPACPIDNGAAVCEDPSCGSVYECVNGAWSFLQTCPGYSADAAPHPVAEAGPTCTAIDASIDAPPGAFGGNPTVCTELEAPDCQLGQALTCGCNGCQDLWVCGSGGWDIWGECTDAGIVATP